MAPSFLWRTWTFAHLIVCLESQVLANSSGAQRERNLSIGTGISIVWAVSVSARYQYRYRTPRKHTKERGKKFDWGWNTFFRSCWCLVWGVQVAPLVSKSSDSKLAENRDLSLLARGAGSGAASYRVSGLLLFWKVKIDHWKFSSGDLDQKIEQALKTSC